MKKTIGVLVIFIVVLTMITGYKACFTQSTLEKLCGIKLEKIDKIVIMNGTYGNTISVDVKNINQVMSVLKSLKFRKDAIQTRKKGFRFAFELCTGDMRICDIIPINEYTWSVDGVNYKISSSDKSLNINTFIEGLYGMVKK